MKVIKSYGTSGAVVISPGCDESYDFEIGRPVFITFDGLPVPFYVESAEPKGGRTVVKFEDIDTLRNAEELTGKTVSFSADMEEDTCELPFVGMTVYDAGGKLVGKVVEFNNYNGNTCIDVEYRGETVTLPINEQLIVKVKKEKIFLTIPEGLLL